MAREFAHHTQLLLCEPETKQDNISRNQENDDGSDEDTNNISRYNAARMLVQVQKVVRIPALCCVGKVRERKIQRQ